MFSLHNLLLLLVCGVQDHIYLILFCLGFCETLIGHLSLLLILGNFLFKYFSWLYLYFFYFYFSSYAHKKPFVIVLGDILNYWRLRIFFFSLFLCFHMVSDYWSISDCMILYTNLFIYFLLIPLKEFLVTNIVLYFYRISM